MGKIAIFVDTNWYYMPVLPVANGKDQVMCVKFWRKGDFDRLMAHVEKHFSDIIFVEECL